MPANSISSSVVVVFAHGLWGCCCCCGYWPQSNTVSFDVLTCQYTADYFSGFINPTLREKPSLSVLLSWQTYARFWWSVFSYVAAFIVLVKLNLLFIYFSHSMEGHVLHMPHDFKIVIMIIIMIIIYRPICEQLYRNMLLWRLLLIIIQLIEGIWRD